MSKILGLNIRRCREALGMDQGDLADIIECNKNQISFYELGKGSPVYKRILRFADALNVPVEELVRGDSIDKTI